MYKYKSLENQRLAINHAFRQDELAVVDLLLASAELTNEQNQQADTLARGFVNQVRTSHKRSGSIDTFLNEYALSSEEGIALMCLAEALLRVPDKKTADELIKDKIARANWKSHQGGSESFFVNATTWALMLTGKVLAGDNNESSLSKALNKVIGRAGEGVIRRAVDTGMRIMSKQFVMGRTIDEATKRAKKLESIGYRYSYDMLGEAAITADDAERYYQAYADSIASIGKKSSGKTIYDRAGISIKLSALHPRYEVAKYDRVMAELCPRLLSLAELAKQHNIALTVDAEESERLDLSLDVIEQVFSSPTLTDWNGFGMAVQSYQKRAFYVLDWVAELARKHNKRMMVRLIKGAYWDSEIKKAQMNGLEGYPVFTRKCFTDVSFQACAKKILTMTDAIYPQFATHNAYSVAMILSIVGDYKDFEFQCLHGMGRELYQQVVPKDKLGIPCRIYAPVGSHEDLLPYLVRRLLENGANTSFVNRIADDKAPIDSLVVSPVIKAKSYLDKINQNIPLPKDIYGAERKNSKGLDIDNFEVLEQLKVDLQQFDNHRWTAQPLIANSKTSWNKKTAYAPFDEELVIGEVAEATVDDIDWALQQAQQAFPHWAQLDVNQRADYLLKIADKLEQEMLELIAIAQLEAGKTLNDAIAEVREAVDFCHYYAKQAKRIMAEPIQLQGYTGELNQLSLHPRGTCLCISPWNFPLAIFVGQITAALAVGNCVIAKPAEQTPMMAYKIINLFYQVGIPQGVVQLLPGDGATIGARLVEDERIKAVMFTGSTITARIINQSLAQRKGEIIPFIAETGGQNAMIVDSSALLEQVVVDVIASSFGSAGQRCSALRVIYVQKDVMKRFNTLLQGAMNELKVGDPREIDTDVGPVIDLAAYRQLKAHIKSMKQSHSLLHQLPRNLATEKGHFIAPTAIKIDSIDNLSQEQFGPILHVIEFKSKDLDKVIAEINSTGFGLTLGVHSRINSTIDYIQSRVKVGNCYVNRNMIGAVVGLQPFGGEGLSGTGPKAGGPHYLFRLCNERTLTIDTTAAGGNASLMTEEED